MNISVHLYTILKKYGKGRIGENNSIVLPEPMSLEELANHLDIPEKLGKTFLVNNTPCSKEYLLKDGDTVKIFAFIGGG